MREMQAAKEALARRQRQDELREAQLRSERTVVN